jgi:putative NADH-flavin reductase
MKVLVVGATGATGIELVQQAAAAGHEVTALARDPAKVPERSGVRAVQGDVLEPATLVPAVAGQDAVLNVIGARKDSPADIRTVGMRHLVAAMKEQGVGRLVAISSFGAGDSHGQGGFMYSKVIAPLFLKKIIADQDGSEEVVKASGLEWTIVRPTRLTDGPGTGKWDVIATGGGMGAKIARADVAAFMLQALGDATYVGKAPGITS